MKKIPLTRGQFALISDEDFERVSHHSWCMHPCGYAKARIKTRYVLMHRWIIGAKPGQMMDHINGNKLDNRRENLRFCTISQNIANRPISISNNTGYKGVGYRKDRKKYRARIKVNGKEIHLGYFDTPQEAARRYDQGAKTYFGEFAFLNQVEA